MKKPFKSTPLQVEISDIDLNPGPFCMSFHFDLGPLKASIEGFGILNPPYLVKNSSFTVVAGYRRLLAAREMGWRDVGCRILPGDFPPLDALLLNLHDNVTARQFNPIEKGMVLKRLARYLTKEEMLSDYMPMLELPSHMRTLKLYLSFEDLDDGVKVSVATGRLSMKAVEMIRVLSMEDQREIHRLFTTLKWSFNLQRQAILWIMEIADREGRSIREVIEGERIAEVLNDGKMNGPQKVRAIVKALREMRYPTVTEFERSFKRGVSDLALPSRVRIIPPPFFEGADYTLEIVFREGKELKEKVARLYHTVGLEEIADFWKTKNRV